MTYFNCGVTTTSYFSAMAITPVEESSEPAGQIAPPPLPPAPRPFSLNGLRRSLSSVHAGRITLQEGSSDLGKLVFDLGIQPHDPDHARFYNAVAAYVMRRCEAVLHLDKQRLMQIEAPKLGPARAAMDEARMLVDFVQRIGGSLEHICVLLHDPAQTQTVIDIHSVFAGDPAAPSIEPVAVKRLSDGFAAAERPDLQLALLDVMLPQCPAGRIKLELAKQWIDLATGAMEEANGPPLSLQWVVMAALHNDPDLGVDRGFLDAMEMLERNSVLRQSTSEVSVGSSLVGSPASWLETDAVSTVTPDWREGREPINCRTRLMLACASGDIGEVWREVEICMQDDADIDQQDALGGTALKLACENGHLEAVKYLLQMGANPNLPDNMGRTPMDWAVGGNYTEVVEVLGAAGAITVRQRSHSVWATRRDRLGSRASDSALSASRSPAPLARSKSVRIKSIAGATIENLVKACSSNDFDAVEDCLARKVDSNDKDSYGRGPLHSACQHGDDPRVVELLVKTGARLEERDKADNTPLMVACHKRKYAIVKTLLEMGANPSSTNKLGMTPLMVASQFGNEDIVQQLWDAQAELEIKCKKGRTALAYAAASGQIPVAKFLLTKGAEINTKDKGQVSPLMHAAGAGQIGMVKLLLGGGADRSAVDRHGRTAADYAAAKNHTMIVKTLKRGTSRKSLLKKIFS